ncbi:uncharacterized protein CCR75_002133 [Bremia lactucae]|uniref:Uncharacterized protein n=1 Tax=Bremia lactucae TaxID=4779 RepID=A0A976FD29_BRELC|nr:hypothetical protein CCR75_002133 [Bremia lactucae]
MQLPPLPSNVNLYFFYSMLKKSLSSYEYRGETQTNPAGEWNLDRRIVQEVRVISLLCIHHSIKKSSI